jgi:hypothetical protein
MAADVRLPGVVARAALISALASVVIPGLVGSRAPSAPSSIDPAAFRQVDLGPISTTTTTLALDPANLSDGSLDGETVLREPQTARISAAAPRPGNVAPNARVIVRDIWKLDPDISWYGPGFYGNGGACGMFGANGLGPEDIGVAHRTLPCGTRVTFRYNGRTVVTQVKDRGPYVPGRIWDMTRGLCEALGHCFTGGGVYYRIG